MLRRQTGEGWAEARHGAVEDDRMEREGEAVWVEDFGPSWWAC